VMSIEVGGYGSGKVTGKETEYEPSMSFEYGLSINLCPSGVSKSACSSGKVITFDRIAWSSSGVKSYYRVPQIVFSRTVPSAGYVWSVKLL
jgi:hypothetical protein